MVLLAARMILSLLASTALRPTAFPVHLLGLSLCYSHLCLIQNLARARLILWLMTVRIFYLHFFYFAVVVQLLTHVRVFVTPWTAAHQASLSFTISRSLLKLMCIEIVRPCNHLILCYPILLLSSIFPSIRVYSDVWCFKIRCRKYWSCSFSISPRNEYS